MSNGPLTRFALSELLVIRGFGFKPSRVRYYDTDYKYLKALVVDYQSVTTNCTSVADPQDIRYNQHTQTAADNRSHTSDKDRTAIHKLRQSTAYNQIEY